LRQRRRERCRRWPSSPGSGAPSQRAKHRQQRERRDLEAFARGLREIRNPKPQHRRPCPRQSQPSRVSSPQRNASNPRLGIADRPARQPPSRRPISRSRC